MCGVRTAERSTVLIRNPFVSPEIMPIHAIASHTRFMQQRPFSWQKLGSYSEI
ncbi:MAG: hypothetical protein VB140_09745 [Burkholderia sp.]